MFELILNATKITFSEDVRKGMGSLLEVIRRSPEWQRDICTLEASIQKLFSEQASILCSLTRSKMEKLGYKKHIVDAFNTSYHELMCNGFEYGCQTEKDSIGIIIAITGDYVSLIVTNPKKYKFKLTDAVKNAEKTLTENSKHKRGRGLLLVQSLADMFEALPTEDGVKAVFFYESVDFKINTFADVTVIETISGLYNVSFSRRLISTALQYCKNNIILNFQRWHAGSVAYFVTLELDDLLSESSSRIVALQPYTKLSEVILPESLVAYSWYEALEKISRTNLFPQIEKELLDDWSRNLERNLRQDH
jgi:anti-sigma regulatory factor (Ser/Thr protein kinase)